MFGDRVDDDEEPKANRRDRFRQLEAKQREKEGLPELGIRGLPVPPVATPPRPPITRDPNGPCEYACIQRCVLTDTIVLEAPQSPPRSDVEEEGTSTYCHRLTYVLQYICRIPRHPLPDEQREEEGIQP